MLKVMIVDNESAIRKGLVHCIHWGDLGCEIAAQADDGMMALEQIPVIQPNIVISDIRMPGMDGLELAEIIARDHPGIKVIILTGYPDFAYAQRAIQYHVVDFVLKPMTVENLTNAIEKAKAAIAEDRSSQDLQEKLSTTSARNMELQQSMLLHDLIHRVACSQLYVLNRLAQLKMDLHSYFVLKLHITSLSEEALTEEEYNEYLNQSQEILSDCLSSYQHYTLPAARRTALWSSVPPVKHPSPHCARKQSILSEVWLIFCCSLAFPTAMTIPSASPMPPTRPHRRCASPSSRPTIR